MEKKKSEFDEFVDKVLKDEDWWNDSVKNKEYRICKDDTVKLKVIKIYRHLNEHDPND